MIRLGASIRATSVPSIGGIDVPQEREMIATVVERLKKAAAQPKDLEAEALIRQETATLASCKYEFDPHARRTKRA